MDTNFILFYIIGIAAVFIGGILAYLLSRRFKWGIPLWVFYVIIASSGYLFFAQYFKYQSLHFYADFSHWIDLLYGISMSGKPWSASVEFIVPGGLNYFSVHFVPLIYLFAVPFKFFPYGGTIIFLNGLLMLSSAIPLYKLAVRLGGDKRFGLFIAALLLWYPTFQYTTLYEFEMLRFSIPILLWMLYFFETRRMMFYLFFVVLAILVREEMGLTVTMFGVYALLFAKRRREGVLAIVLGLGGFAVITSIIMPALRGGEYAHIAAGVFSQFGSTPLEIVKGVVSQPFLAAQTVFNPIKFADLFMLGLPLLFVPLLAPSVLLGALANVSIGLLSEAVVHTSYMLYYIAPSVPFIFYAFIKAWPKLINWFKVSSAVMAAVLSGLLVSNIFFSPAPISLQFWSKNLKPAPFKTQDFHYSVYKITDHHKRLEQFVNLIPSDAVVSTQQFIQPRLFKKAGAMTYPQLISKDGSTTADYVLIDKTNNNLGEESPAYIAQKDFDLVETDEEAWQVIRADDGYILYVRK